MSSTFSSITRKFVATRAGFRCEYCHKPEIISNFSFHIEHIISRQHGGTDQLTNLAFACSWCNWKKGPNIATKLEEEGPIIALFHPRKESWQDHFQIDNGILIGKTAVGQGTIRLLDMNTPELISERKLLIEIGLYS